MSEAVAGCWILAAARGDEGSYTKVLRAMRYELETGARTLFPCDCQPLCPQPTRDQFEALAHRLHAELDGAPESAITR